MDGPPEITSGQLHAGAGASSLHAASLAWAQLAAELRSAAAGTRSTATALENAWSGSAADRAIVEVQRHAARITALADAAHTASTSAANAASAFTAARTTVTAPAAITRNRALRAYAAATNVLGQHTTAIALLDSAYEAMWAHNTAVMQSYSAQSSAATDPLGGLLNSIDGGSGTPLSSFLNSSFTNSWTNVLASGFAPTAIVSDVTGFGFLTAFMQQAAAMQTIRDTITAPSVTVVPAVPPTPPVAATAVAGAARPVGVLSAPRSWGAAADPAAAPVVLAAPGGAPSAMPESAVPAALPTLLPATATGQRRSRDDPEYGERPRVMPRTPAGG